MKRYLFLLLCFVLPLFSACGAEPDLSEEPQDSPSQIEEESHPSHMETTATGEDGETYFEAAVDMPDAMAEQMPENSLAALWTEADLFIERAQAEANMARSADADWRGNYDMTFSLFYSDESIVSVVADLYSYSEGAAHPQIGRKGYTFDAVTGDRLQLDDFLVQGESAYVAAQISSSIRSAGEEDLYFPDLENLLQNRFQADQWYTDGTTVYVCYNPGEIAPVAMGTLEFPLTCDKVD